MLGIIIINYKSEKLTIEYVQRELSKIFQPRIVVIVNNAATEISDALLCTNLDANRVKDISIIPEQSNTGIYVISSDDNLGFARGNNLGVKFLNQHFNIEYLLFSNNDIQIIDSDICERLIEKMEADPRIGMIGPKVVGLSGEYQSPEPYVSMTDHFCWMYLATPFMSAEQKRKRFKLDYGKTAEEGFHYKVMGSFFMVRTVDYMACGMMDEFTFLYGEEVILSERLNSIGKQAYYFPQVSVIHAHGVTTNKNLGKKGINKYSLDSMMYYYRTYMHEPKWKCRLCKWIYLVVLKIR